MFCCLPKTIAICRPNSAERCKSGNPPGYDRSRHIQQALKRDLSGGKPVTGDVNKVDAVALVN